MGGSRMRLLAVDSSDQLPVVDLEQRIQQLLAQGDLRAAATEAIRGLGPVVLRYLGSVLHDEADVTEAFGCFAESLWRGLPSYQHRASFRTWALRLAWNCALDVRNEAWRRRGRPFQTGEMSALAAELQTTSSTREAQHRVALDRLRAALTPEERALLALRVDQELSWQEVAEVLSPHGGVPLAPSTLMKRFERLKERLGRLAREQGLLD
ncbi:MAG TPA: sigma-70 family RNA polymerase sigma factor [Anaeromyxobacteraceae bacterium]|nr:sigma-70 family RNA polymerase sigma factor [Anaeromyxobacteraceae bacterium]